MRSGTTLFRVAGLLVTIACLVAATGNAASSGTVVGATVPGATSIDNQCTGAPATDFGPLTVGTSITTDTGAGRCRFAFGSSNSTATARIVQRDRSGTAMGRYDPTDWADVSPTIVTNTAHDLVTATRAFRARSDGQIDRSDDGGATWTAEVSGSTAPFHAIAAIDADNAYAVGGDPAHIATRSTAGGSTWTTRPVPGSVTGSLYDVAFDPTNPDVALAVTNEGEVVRTTDRGASWSEVANIGTILVGVTILDPSLAYAGGLLGTPLHRSTDGGLTWSPVSLPGSIPWITDVLLTAGPVLWVNGADGVYRSFDPAAPTPSFTNLVAIGAACIPGRLSAPSPNIVFTSHCSAVLRSTNALDPTPTFSVSGIPTLERPMVDAVSASQALDVGEGSIQHTTDGSTWTLLQHTRSQVTDVDTFGSDVVAISAGLGYVYTTVDGGATWSTRNVGDNDHLRSVLLDDEDTLWVAASDGLVHESNDLGATWSAHPTGVVTSLNGIGRAHDGALIVVGNGGQVRRSSDSGASWQPVNSGTAADLLELDIDESSGEMWTVKRYTNELLRSTDHGRTWTTVVVTGATGVRTVAVAGPGSAWVLDDSLSGWRTTDGGATWTPASTPTGAISIDAIDTRHAIVGIGFSGQLQVTRDGGATWTASSYSTGFTNPIVKMVDATTGYSIENMGLTHRMGPVDPIPDYAGGAWAGGTSMLGVCLQDVGASTTAVWTRDVTGTPGRCEASDTDPWRALPTTPDPVAQTNVVGATGSIDLVFGLKVAPGQPPGAYLATFDVEVVSPG